MREKARQYPIYKCYVNPPDWQEQGIAQIIVTRKRKEGQYALACFLVDTFCLGVKDVLWHSSVDDEDIKYYLDRFDECGGYKEISYDEAHNIIYGAIEFAAEGGVTPDKDFAIGSFILEEDTDDIPLIEYKFGMNGKHVLMIAARPEDARWAPILHKNLGDNFRLVYLDKPDDFDDEEYEEEYDDESPDIDEQEKIDEVLNIFKSMLNK